MYTVDVALSDVDRGVYESLSIKAACHPSETEEYFATRILAYCLEYKEGISFSKGLSEADVPAISVRDLTGALTAWIEIGSPHRRADGVDRDRLAGCGAAAQGEQGVATRGGVHAQGAADLPARVRR